MKLNDLKIIPFLGILLAMLGLSALVWMKIPDGTLIATHWGIDGSADGFSNKAIALLVMPKVMFFVLLLYAFIPLLEPRKENFAKSLKVYNTIFFCVIIILACAHVFIILHALGIAFNVTRAMFALLGIFFVVIGNLLGKVRSNFMMGFRSPWTLSSETCWNKTHRLGGRLFVIWGMLTALSAIFGWNNQAMVILFFSGAFAVSVVPFVYSSVIWKKEKSSI